MAAPRAAAEPVKAAVRIVAALASLGLAGAALASCGADGDPRVVVVPTDAPTIQQAVDRVAEGGLVLVEPGEYSEEVSVTRPNIHIRGLDRNEVILNGQHRLGNGFIVTADGVSVENLTVHSYAQNGILFTGAEASADYEPGSEGEALEGYWVSHVTAYNNGLYGVYAFASVNGVIKSSYASGHPDSGFYVGQCRPCDVLIDDVTAENNAIGYYGTNASDGVWVVNSRFVGNRLGVAPNSQDLELLSPQRATTVAGNLIADNDNPGAPEIPDGYFGVGIAVGGGRDNVIWRNRITGHLAAGVVVQPLGGFAPEGNTVRENVLEGNAVDLVMVSDGTSKGNCFAGNVAAVTLPARLQQLLGCDTAGVVPAQTFATPAPPRGPSNKDVPRPGAQQTMDAPRTAPSPTVGPPTFPVLEAIQVPAPR